MAGNDFERFYYRNVALGEGCGCAEQIITTRELEVRYGPGARRLGIWARIVRLLRRRLRR